MFEISDIVTLLKKIERRIIYDDFNGLGLIIVSLTVCEITQPEKRNIIKNAIFNKNVAFLKNVISKMQFWNKNVTFFKNIIIGSFPFCIFKSDVPKRVKIGNQLIIDIKPVDPHR